MTDTPARVRPARTPPPAEVHLPDPGDLLLIGVALVAVSTSGPLVAATTAPALAIAFWRNALSLVLLVPASLLRCRAEIAALTGREWRVMLLAGVLLAAHFATWIPSLTFTTVATATALVATQPVWAGLVARAQGRTIPRRAWAGIGVAVAGAVLLTGVDLAGSSRVLVGDGLALLGRAVRRALHDRRGPRPGAASAPPRTRPSATAPRRCSCGAVCLVADLPLTAATRAATGSSSSPSPSAPSCSATPCSTRCCRPPARRWCRCRCCVEIPGAALIAAVFLGQVPPLAAIPGALLLGVGIALTVTSAPVVAVPAE